MIVWVPYEKGGIEALEKVQKRATKILPALRHLIAYSDWLKACTQTTLHCRQIADMIETYKIHSEKYEWDSTKFTNPGYDWLIE